MGSFFVAAERLLIDLEGLVAFFEEIDDLSDGGDAGVDVGFFGLGTALFGCAVIAVGIFLFEFGSAVGGQAWGDEPLAPARPRRSHCANKLFRIVSGHVNFLLGETSYSTHWGIW